MSGFVARVLTSSFIDGPGHRAVVFMQGCDFSCLYCHNPETQRLCTGCGACLDSCPKGALSIREGRIFWKEESCALCDACLRACPNHSSPRVKSREAGELSEEILSLLPFIDGVTFSGGECSLQSGFLVELAAILKKGALERGSSLSLIADTNGGTGPSAFASLLESMDGFIFDLKAPDEKTHRALTGLPLAPVLSNMEAAARAGKLVELRTVLVEGWNDGKEAIEAASCIFASLGSIPTYRLIPFRPLGVKGQFASIPPYPEDKYESIVGVMRESFGDRIVKPVF